MENLNSKIQELKSAGLNEEIIEQIRQWIVNAPDAKLYYISPFPLADEWDLDRYEVLDVFLHGTRIGIFDLEWNIRCPSCTGSTSKQYHLEHLHNSSHCDYCGIDIGGSFDESVEVTFRLNSQIRKLPDVSFGEYVKAKIPFNPPVVFNIPAGEKTSYKEISYPSTYHIFDEKINIGVPIWIQGEPLSEERSVLVEYDGNTLKRKNTDKYRPGPLSIIIENNSSHDIKLFLSRAEEIPWVSGMDVASNQNFRDLFTSELIATDEHFSVKSLVFVFTDIKGSTSLYEKLGDSNAYSLVKEHFKILTNKVKNRHGAVVKTIGDAIMATFTHPKDAAMAILDAYEDFHHFNNTNKDKDDIIIKVGAHYGPCLAVNSNDKIDYFGRTVNIAARIQGLSQGQDIYLSNDLFTSDNISKFISENGWNYELQKHSLKGITSDYNVVHLTKNYNHE